MPTISFSARCKAATITAGAALALGLLAMSTGSMLLSKRVKAESGERLVKCAEHVATHLTRGLDPSVTVQVCDELSRHQEQIALFVTDPSGQVLLSSLPGSENLKLELRSQASWQITRWPDGQVYLSGSAQIAGRHDTVRIREPLDIALVEVQKFQWNIFQKTLLITLLAGLLGGSLTGKWRRQGKSNQEPSSR